VVVTIDEWVKELTLEMIPEGIFRNIAERIGIGNLIELADIVGGVTFYIPKKESLLRPIRDRHIKEEFNGFNHALLAQKYNLSERWVRGLCGEGWAEGQLNLFGNNDDENTLSELKL